MAKIGEINKEHSVCIKDRSEMTLSGVGEVVSFSDNVVIYVHADYKRRL